MDHAVQLNAVKPTVIVTGAAGNLGLRLLPQIDDFSVCGVDMFEPRTDRLARFQRMDLGSDEARAQFVNLLRETKASAVVHLAFVIDPVRTGVLDVDRMWQINVAGTSRIMDAIAEVNRTGGNVQKFVFPSSVSAYGPELPECVNEDYPLGAKILPYALHKQESDELVRKRAVELGPCSTYVLRPHIYAGASMQNYLIGVLRGTATGKGRIAAAFRRWGVRLPMVLPRSGQYLEKKFQFVHVDDVARLIAWILRRSEGGAELVVLNVPGGGSALTLRRCAEIAHARVIRLPSMSFCRATLRLMWNLGVSGVPPDALPYMLGSYTMDSSRLRAFLGKDYERVVQYSVEAALADSFRPAAAPSPGKAEAAVP